MAKLRKYIELWMSGKEVRGISNVSPQTRHELVSVYNSLVRREKIEFIDGKIKEILEKCGIECKQKGIGWEV